MFLSMGGGEDGGIEGHERVVVLRGMREWWY